jgi:ketosteroid isomerase-like protein
VARITKRRAFRARTIVATARRRTRNACATRAQSHAQSTRGATVSIGQNNEQQPADAAPTPGTTAAQGHPSTGPIRSERVVEQASRESFPASDPPAFTPARPGRADRQADDVPLLAHDEHREQARAWAERLCVAFDDCDAEAIAGMLAEDAVVRVGQAPLLVGRETARRWLASYLDAVGSAVHHLVDVRIDGDAVVIESEVNVRTADGVKMMCPEAISVRMRRDVASRLTVYGGPADFVVPGS